MSEDEVGGSLTTDSKDPGPDLRYNAQALEKT